MSPRASSTRTVIHGAITDWNRDQAGERLGADLRRARVLARTVVWMNSNRRSLLSQKLADLLEQIGLKPVVLAQPLGFNTIRHELKLDAPEKAQRLFQSLLGIHPGECSAPG